MNETKKVALICDLDGTLASLKRSPFDFEKIHLDDLNTGVAKILQFYPDTIFLITGREEKYRTQTEMWLKKHHIRYDQLFMRPTGDRRKDFIVKKEIFRRELRDFEIDFVLEDRDQAVAMWRNIGLTCLQVDYGNY